jgi:hypothetical protein
MPQISSVMYAHDDGDEYMLLQSQGAWKSRLTRPESWGDVEEVRVWSSDQDDKSIERRELDYDSRARPWHQGALQRLQHMGGDAPVRERIHWTEPYTFFTTKEPGVTASLAHRIPSGQLVVLGFDILLADISRFTSKIEIGERGKVFVLRGEPAHPQKLAVIGLPADERFADDASMIEFVLSPPDDLGGAVASFVREALTSNATEPGKAVKFTHEGEAWWGEIAQSKLRTTDDIWVGSIVPEQELLEGLPDSSLIVIVTTGIVLLLAMLRASWLARRYATPLEALTERGNRMQRLNFEPVEPVGSDITEIRHLSATLERMRAALQTFSAAREDLRVARSIRDMAMPARLQAPSGVDVAVWHEPSEDLGGECYDAVSVLAEDGKTVRCMVLAMFDFPGAGVAAGMSSRQSPPAAWMASTSSRLGPALNCKRSSYDRQIRPLMITPRAAAAPSTDATSVPGPASS